MFTNNRVLSLLGSDFPILQGGMAWASDAKLACSVSNSGGFGIVGCAGRQKPWVLKQIKYSKENTFKQIGLNVALSDCNASDVIKIAIDHNINVFTMGGANTYLKLISKYGSDVLIIPLVGSVIEAKIAERAGAQIIICEGQESGGSIGRLSLFSLLPQVVDAVNIPVIAAGGIADGRGMRAAFSLGAEGIQMGTRFLASNECSVIAEYKSRIVKARDTDSLVISRKINRPTRVVKNKFALDYLSKEKNSDENDLKDFVRGKLKMAVESDANIGAMHGGEISGLIRDVKSCSQIIKDIINEFSSQFNFISQQNKKTDNQISKLLKHKPPILLVQRIDHLEPGCKCVASINLEDTDWFFKCHYPNYPVMPGALLIEAMSQVLVLAVSDGEKLSQANGPGVLLNKVSNAIFHKEVIPGMKIKIEANVISSKRGIINGAISCISGDDLVCSSEQTILIPSILRDFLKK